MRFCPGGRPDRCVSHKEIALNKTYLPVSLRCQAGLALAVLSLTVTAASAAPQAGDYALITSNRIGGTGGWDYIASDAAGARVFISRGDHVDVYDTASGKVAGQIPGTSGVHGIALNEKSNRGYTSNGKGNSITVFDLSTLKVVKEVPIAGQNPDAILYEPVTDRLYTFNGKSKDVTVLNATTLETIATVPVPGKPEFAVADEAGRVYANIETEPGQLVVIDGKVPALKATWPLPGCNSPTGLALDAAHHRLFSVCDDKVMAVTNALTGKQVARVAIGEGPDAVAYDAALGLVFSSNGEGTLTIVKQESPDRYTVAKTLGTARGARTMALDAKSHRVYLVTSDFGAAPAPTADVPHPRPPQVPDTFTVHVAGPR